MKREPAKESPVQPPERTPFERFEDLAKKLISVPKREADEAQDDEADRS